MTFNNLRAYMQWNRFAASNGIRQVTPDNADLSMRNLLASNYRYLDMLIQNQQLVIDDQLESKNHLLNLKMESDGALTLYRTLYNRALWAAKTSAMPIKHTIMKADGNLSVCGPDNSTYWETHTQSHPGSKLILQDDGNLVISDSNNNLLWNTGTTQNFDSPTFIYRDVDGYTYTEVSEKWIDFCSVFPCFDQLQWPDYSSTHINTVINNQPVVIQLWKGWCPKFLWIDDFPGGIGAEVGIYRRMPGRSNPNSLPGLSIPPTPEELLKLTPETIGMLAAMALLGDDNIWWPITDYETIGNPEISFELINPKTGKVFIKARPEKNTYWLTKWMDEESYSEYKRSTQTPDFHDQYKLRFKINGTSYPIW